MFFFLSLPIFSYICLISLVITFIILLLFCLVILALFHSLSLFSSTFITLLLLSNRFYPLLYSVIFIFILLFITFILLFLLFLLYSTLYQFYPFISLLLFNRFSPLLYLVFTLFHSLSLFFNSFDFAYSSVYWFCLFRYLVYCLFLFSIDLTISLIVRFAYSSLHWLCLFPFLLDMLIYFYYLSSVLHLLLIYPNYSIYKIRQFVFSLSNSPFPSSSNFFYIPLSTDFPSSLLLFLKFVDSLPLFLLFLNHFTDDRIHQTSCIVMS